MSKSSDRSRRPASHTEPPTPPLTPPPPVNAEALDSTSAVIFGYNAVSEALRGSHPLNRIYFSLSSRRPHIQELKALAIEQGVRFDFVDVAKLNVLAGTGEHQDVVAISSPVEYTDLDEFLDRTKSAPTLTVVVLDQVQHSGNVGMIIRAAVAAGAHAVLLNARGGSLINDQVFRASAGAIFHIPLIKSNTFMRDLEKLKAHDFWIYGLDATGEHDIYTEKWARRSALVIGNEHAGPRSVTRKQFDLTVRIPMARSFDSLNAALAAGIVLFQVGHYARTQGWTESS